MVNIHVRFVPKDAERGPIADTFIEFGSGCSIFEAWRSTAAPSGRSERASSQPSRAVTTRARPENGRMGLHPSPVRPRVDRSRQMEVENWLVAEYKKTLKASSGDIPF